MADTFYFKRNKELNETPSQQEVVEWDDMIKGLRDVFKKWKGQLYSDKPKSFKVTVDKLKGKELRGYWVLIGVVTKWMNEQGNYFTKEEVSDWFKIQCGHKRRIKGVEIPRSIAVKSDCTWQDMSKLIDYIERFGAENNIVGCELRSGDKEEMKKGFSE